MSFCLGNPQTSIGEQPPAKIEHLHRLAQHRLPIPIGWACPANQAFSAVENNSTIDDLLAQGSVIVRMACEIEDLADASAAGLSLSIGSIRNLTELKDAFQQLQNHCNDPWLTQYQSKQHLAYWVLVQCEIQRSWLVVAAIDAQNNAYVEAHSSPSDVLHMGSSPDYSGPLGLWSHHSSPAIADICQRVTQSFVESKIDCPHGIDLELIVNSNDEAWLVQARPLSAALVSNSQNFVATAIDPIRPQLDSQLKGLYVLDAEHNPAPLSPAHAWLIDELRHARPLRAGDPIALAGWLYVRTLPRNLDSQNLNKSKSDPLGALRHLSQTLLPSIQSQSSRLNTRIQHAYREGLGPCLSLARDHFLNMIDSYLEHIVPFRSTTSSRPGDSKDPLSLRDRQRFLDILPTSWDIASQSLQDLGILHVAQDSAHNEIIIPSDPALANSLLAEWDDHLFALGLLPLRKVWLRAAQLLGVSPDEVFYLNGTELQDWSKGQHILDQPDFLSQLIDQRYKQHQQNLQLSPPLRLFDGQPIPILTGAFLHGISCGGDYSGFITVIAGLEELLARRPQPPAIVCLPTLTAQAAVAIHHLGIQAICTEYGGALSHGALMARELGLSALIGCRGCTSLPDQSKAKIDSRRGRLLIQTAP